MAACSSNHVNLPICAKRAWRLISVDPDLPSPRSVFARPDGQFILNGILPGSYVLEISNLPRRFLSQGCPIRRRRRPGRTTYAGTRDAANPLQILLGSDGGRLRPRPTMGRASFTPARNSYSSRTSRRRDRRERYRVAASGEDGQAILRGIPPGSYKLFAWEDLEPNAYLNADYLQSLRTLRRSSEHRKRRQSSDFGSIDSE